MKVREESEKAGLKLNIQKTNITASGPITSWQNRWGNNGNSDRLFWGGGPPKSLHMVTAAMKLKDACSFKEKLDPPRQHIKRHRHYFANKGPSSQSYAFSSSHEWIQELDYKES